jgi:transcription antitermination protein NusB
MEREKLREMVLQCLHAQEGGAGDEELVSCLMDELKVPKSQVRIALEKAKRIGQEGELLDAILKRVVNEYDFERVQAVERNVLRLALYELWHEPDLPRKVVIAEALRLARKYATPEAAHFVHAILDEVSQKMEPASGD